MGPTFFTDFLATILARMSASASWNASLTDMYHSSIDFPYYTVDNCVDVEWGPAQSLVVLSLVG